jgi:hypothetical protein
MFFWRGPKVDPLRRFAAPPPRCGGGESRKSAPPPAGELPAEPGEGVLGLRGVMASLCEHLPKFGYQRINETHTQEGT